MASMVLYLDRTVQMCEMDGRDRGNSNFATVGIRTDVPLVPFQVLSDSLQLLYSFDFNRTVYRKQKIDPMVHMWKIRSLDRIPMRGRSKRIQSYLSS